MVRKHYMPVQGHFLGKIWNEGGIVNEEMPHVLRTLFIKVGLTKMELQPESSLLLLMQWYNWTTGSLVYFLAPEH